jgi:hypothetical protein
MNQTNHAYVNDQPAWRPRNCGCPDRCAGTPDSGHNLTPDELQHVSLEARHAISRSHGHGLICTYCGCVYIREGSLTRRLGILIGGWHSELFPS